VNDVLVRLRASNPVATRAVEDERLFRAIVAQPREARRPRTLVRLAVVAVALAVLTGAAWAASGLDPAALFRSNPAGADQPGSVWRQEAVPSSIARAETLELAGVGRVELWHAASREGGWCSGLRGPDGVWAGTPGSDGGTVPGCYPAREQVNGESKPPVYELTGLDYYEADFDGRHRGGSYWRVYYGVVSGKRRAARVVDLVSGRSAHIRIGEVFALAIPDADPYDAHDPLRLVAYDRGGRAITR
jgi:hypothetical protein